MKRIPPKRLVGACVTAGLGAIAFGPGFASASGDATFSITVVTSSSDVNLGPYDVVVRCADGTSYPASLHVGQSAAFSVPSNAPMDCTLGVDASLEQQSVLSFAVGDAVDPSDGRIATSNPSRLAQEGRSFTLSVDAEAVPIRIETDAPYLDQSKGPFAVALSCVDGFTATLAMAPTDQATILVPGDTPLDCGAEVVFSSAQAGRFNVQYRDDMGPSNGRLAPGQLASVAYLENGEAMAIYIALSEHTSD
ncbi:MAG: hypothetical protein R2706_07920 [Acidimicrobiales bacterium]